MDTLKLSKRELQITIKQIKSIKISNVLKRNNINIKIFNQFYFYKFYVNNIYGIASSNMYTPLNITLKKTPITYFSYILSYIIIHQFNLTKQEIQFYHFENSDYTYNTKIIIIIIVNLPLNQDAKYFVDE